MTKVLSLAPPMTESPSSESAMSNICICKGAIEKLLDDTLLMQATDHAVRQGDPP